MYWRFCLNSSMSWGPLRIDGHIPATTAPCLHPRCRKSVSFRVGVPGRKAIFCSGRCRTAFMRDREWLISSLARLGADLESGAAGGSTSSQERLLRWHLLHYPKPQIEDRPERLPHEAACADGSAGSPPIPIDVRDYEARNETVQPHSGTDTAPERGPESDTKAEPRPPARDILELAQDASPTVRAWLARHPECPPAVVASLARDSNPQVRRSVAGRTDLSRSVFARLSRDRARSVKAALLATALR